MLGILALANLAAAQIHNPADAQATIIEGSTPTHRLIVDTDYGEVYIYVGGAFPAGTPPSAFEFLFDFGGATGRTTGHITPLRFEAKPSGVNTIYTLVGIGRAFKVNVRSLPQTIPFDILAGVKTTANANFTFGFVNAIVDASGTELASSPGTCDFDEPADSGAGVGGAGTTNAWSVTASPPDPSTLVVALGTTFGAPGSNATYTLRIVPDLLRASIRSYQ